MSAHRVVLPIALLLTCWACETAPNAPEATKTIEATETPETSPGWVLTEDYVPPGNELVNIGFSAPSEWIVETVSSETRKAQYRLPRADGDTEDASVVVEFFGRRGYRDRSVILDRWAARFEPPDGSNSTHHPKPLTSSMDGWYRDADGKRKRLCQTITNVDISGTYVGETTTNSGERVSKEDWRMLASIISTNGTGPCYVELVGPAATVAHWKRSFRRFVSSIHPRP